MTLLFYNNAILCQVVYSGEPTAATGLSCANDWPEIVRRFPCQFVDRHVKNTNHHDQPSESTGIQSLSNINHY